MIRSDPVLPLRSAAAELFSVSPHAYRLHPPAIRLSSRWSRPPPATSDPVLFGQPVRQACGGEGRWEEAVSWYRRGIEADELIEAFYQRLIRSYQHLGRTAEARATGERCRRMPHSRPRHRPKPWPRSEPSDLSQPSALPRLADGLAGRGCLFALPDPSLPRVTWLLPAGV